MSDQEHVYKRLGEMICDRFTLYVEHSPNLRHILSTCNSTRVLGARIFTIWQWWTALLLFYAMADTQYRLWFVHLCQSVRSACLAAFPSVLSICLSVNLSICLSARPPACLCFRLPARLLILLSYLSISLSDCLSVRLPACPYVCLSVSLPVCLSFCLSAFLSVRLSVYMSVCQFFCLPTGVCVCVYLSVWMYAWCLSVCLTAACLPAFLLYPHNILSNNELSLRYPK